VELKPGIKYCDFCGRKVEAAAAPPAAGPARPSGTRRAAGVLAGLAVVGLAVWLLLDVGGRLQRPSPSPAPAAPGSDDKRRAVAACEAAIRNRAPAPFRVISFPASRVSDGARGYTVSGSVDLQSASGELQRKRYTCSVRADGGAGMLVDEGRIY
jgi:hypothetical protein